jgi:quinol-cytochrome oxidoreductase complex cytochrome b subunit
MLGFRPDNDVRFMLLGGTIVGPPALLRFYVLHCIFLPIVASVFMAVHFWRIRKDGNISSPMESEWKAVQTEEIARKKLAANLAKSDPTTKPDKAPTTAEKN